jgi:hypothetical protein
MFQESFQADRNVLTGAVDAENASKTYVHTFEHTEGHS